MSLCERDLQAGLLQNQLVRELVECLGGAAVHLGHRGVQQRPAKRRRQFCSAQWARKARSGMRGHGGMARGRMAARLVGPGGEDESGDLDVAVLGGHDDLVTGD